MLLCLVLLGGCATTRVCNRAAAHQLGQSDALRWDVGRANLRQGSVCTADYSSAQFAQDYSAGFKEALAGRCSHEAASDAGRRAASDSQEWGLDSSRLELCAELGAPAAELRRTYEQAYIETWCSAAHGQALARQHGERLQPETLGWMANCPAERRDELAAVYAAQHGQSLSAACGAPRMASWGITLARENGELAQALAALGACPESLQHDAVASLQRSYGAELQRLAMLREEQRRQQEAERRALAHAQREEQRRVEASRRDYVVKGTNVTLTCSVADGRARVVLVNNGTARLTVAGELFVESYDAAGRPVDSSRTRALFGLSPGEMDETFVFVPSQAVGCLVNRVDFR